MYARLRADVDGRIRRKFPNPFYEAQIRYDIRVDYVRGPLYDVQNLRIFALFYAGIESEIYLYSVEMREFRVFAEVIERKIFRFHTEIEFIDSEIYRVRPVKNGGFKGFLIARGRAYFHFFSSFWNFITYFS
jgi:hypothetical protein